MRLKWETSTNILPQWVADGAHYSYQVTFLPLVQKYQVLKLRQPCGQIVAETFSLTLEGASARAQAWESNG